VFGGIAISPAGGAGMIVLSLLGLPADPATGVRGCLEHHDPYQPTCLSHRHNPAVCISGVAWDSTVVQSRTAQTERFGGSMIRDCPWTPVIVLLGSALLSTEAATHHHTNAVAARVAVSAATMLAAGSPP